MNRKENPLYLERIDDTWQNTLREIRELPEPGPLAEVLSEERRNEWLRHDRYNEMEV